MKQSRFTTRPRIIAGLLVGLTFAIAAAPLVAGTAATPAPQYYDVRQEVTLTGTVSNVLTQAQRGTIPGSHLLLTTASGSVDASLGRWGLVGKGALSVAVGQQIEVTGVMKTLRNKQIFIVRNVKLGSQVYQIRNQYGIPVSPQTRARMSQKAAAKGEAL
jgi:hypothetical protein